MQFFVRRQTLIDKISFLGFVVFGTRGMLLPTTTSAVSQNDPTNKEKLLYSLLYHTKTLFFVLKMHDNCKYFDYVGHVFASARSNYSNLEYSTSFNPQNSNMAKPELEKT